MALKGVWPNESFPSKNDVERSTDQKKKSKNTIWIPRKFV